MIELLFYICLCELIIHYGYEVFMFMFCIVEKIQGLASESIETLNTPKCPPKLKRPKPI